MNEKIVLEKKISEKLLKVRSEYTKDGLRKESVEKSPFAQFAKWLEEALSADITEPNAMMLATATLEGVPSLRTVLLKEFTEDEGFIFYTNYDSRKGQELEKNPKVALMFLWPDLERQIRIEGSVKKIAREKSEEYFFSRPRGSQISSFVSPQSLSIKNRSELEKKYKAAEEEYRDQQIPFPAHWGGYAVKPLMFEFWQGRKDRFHDRIEYRSAGAGEWKTRRLAP